MQRYVRYFFVVGALGVCVLSAILWSRTSNQRPGNTGTLTNQISGTSLYVPESVCAVCHQEQSRAHAESGHANTFHRADHNKIFANLDGKTFDDPERGYTYHYHYSADGDLTVTIPDRFGPDAFPLTFALGSGQHAMTFLSLIPNRLGDTVGIEHRVSLYAAENGWQMDLTPGHQGENPQQDVEHWGKVIRGDTLTSCVNCHTTNAEIANATIRHLRPNVGCQSCHGPGREHVLAMELGRADTYSGFVDQAATSEIEMCGRCHRLPDRGSRAPSLPHAAGQTAQDAGIQRDDKRIVRFQSVGLLQSKCFQNSNDQLKCSTCHNPHSRVSRDVGAYVEKCLQCHSGNASVTCSISPKTDCIRCHMPAVDVHRGITFHNHWIGIGNELP